MMKNSNYLDKEQLLLKKQSIKNIFYRICGNWMDAAAILFKEAGYIVEGGDN